MWNGIVCKINLTWFLSLHILVIYFYFIVFWPKPKQNNILKIVVKQIILNFYIISFTWSTEELSLKFSVPGCKFGDFARIYDKYQTVLIERILTNNRRHNAALAPNWNWVHWNYGETRGRKRSMKVAIITHFATMQQIDEYPALINVGEDNVYSWGHKLITI